MVMSASAFITTNLMTILIPSIDFTTALPACYNCDLGCNDTVSFIDGNMDSSELIHPNRIRRRSSIEQHSCRKFQLELVLIPLSIAMIPLGLCALLVCVCFCGPKESRGKVPEMFKKKAEIDAKDENEIDNDELTCRDGIVMRKDSKKTRFSTVISFIEANGVDDGITRNDRSIIPNELLLPVMEEAECIGRYDGRLTMNSDKLAAVTTASVEQVLINGGKLGNTGENDISESDHGTRQLKSKHTRFSDDINVAGEMDS